MKPLITPCLFWKEALQDSLVTIEVPQKDILLDEIHIKVDNANKRYFLTSFYYKQKRGNIEGFIFMYGISKPNQPIMQNTVTLG